jgi:hypothetical protein
MATRVNTATSGSDEIFFQNEGISLCLLVNRHAATMRVVDFRSGPHPAKRLFVSTLARREGVERVYTLVERDEVGTWARLGFQREGTIPGFYKRSDAFILGMLVDPPDDAMRSSGVRPVAASVEDADPLHDRVYSTARRLAKERADQPLPQARVQVAREVDVRRSVGNALRAGRALTTFEPFGRDVERLAFACTARGGFSLCASVEMQPCFNNAFLELLTAPRTEKEASLTTASVRLLCDELFERDVVCCFALSPVDDSELAWAYAANGFRRTGVLRSHVRSNRGRLDAFLWSRKLAQATDG